METAAVSVFCFSLFLKKRPKAQSLNRTREVYVKNRAGVFESHGPLSVCRKQSASLTNEKGSLLNYTPGFQKPRYGIHIPASGSSQESRPHSCMMKRFDYTSLQKSLEKRLKYMPKKKTQKEKTLYPILPLPLSFLSRPPSQTISPQLPRNMALAENDPGGRSMSICSPPRSTLPFARRSILASRSLTRCICARRPSPQLSMPSSTRCGPHRTCSDHQRRCPSSGAPVTKRSLGGVGFLLLRDLSRRIWGSKGCRLVVACGPP